MREHEMMALEKLMLWERLLWIDLTSHVEEQMLEILNWLGILM